MQPFTPRNTALLLIDHQVGTMQLIRNIDRNLAAKQAVDLAKMAKILGIPTILTASQEDRAQDPLLPELSSILPDAYAARIKRPGVVNAWAYPAFKAAVVATGKKNLIMAGVTTDVCLIFPAIDAAKEGFGVQAVIDTSGWQEQLFLNAPQALAGKRAPEQNQDRQRIEKLEQKIRQKDEVLAELMVEHVAPKEELGEL